MKKDAIFLKKQGENKFTNCQIFDTPTCGFKVHEKMQNFFQKKLSIQKTLYICSRISVIVHDNTTCFI